MNKLTAQEIIEKAKEYCESISGFAYGDFDDDLAGPFKEVHSTGGEGEGSHWTRTYHFTDHDVYLKVTGYYQSHYGTDFDDGWNCVKEVKPKEKTITVYE
jgi:hypothetical protein